MKVIANIDKAGCLSCGAVGQLSEKLSCSECGSIFITDVDGGAFKPIYVEDDYYQVNSYTPKLKDRRTSRKKYPIIKERRKDVLYPA